MLEINWTPLVFLFIAIFALAGLYKGWWKEAITTIFLTILVFLLQLPPVAEGLVNFINFIIVFFWNLLPVSWQATLGDFLEAALSLDLGGGPPLLDAGASQTWIIILIIFIAAAKLVGRYRMRSSGSLSFPYFGYVVTRRASILGGILGGLNGLLIVNLIQSYLDGRRLPGGENATPRVAQEVLLQAVEVPSVSITDGFFPWFLMGLGLVAVLVAIRSRLQLVRDKKEGYRKIDLKTPIGQGSYKVVPPPPPK